MSGFLAKPSKFQRVVKLCAGAAIAAAAQIRMTAQNALQVLSLLTGRRLGAGAGMKADCLSTFNNDIRILLSAGRRDRFAWGGVANLQISGGGLDCSPMQTEKC